MKKEIYFWQICYSTFIYNLSTAPLKISIIYIINISLHVYETVTIALCETPNISIMHNSLFLCYLYSSFYNTICVSLLNNIHNKDYYADNLLCMYLLSLFLYLCKVHLFHSSLVRFFFLSPYFFSFNFIYAQPFHGWNLS